MALEITTTTVEGGTIVAATGEVDVSCAAELREAVNQAIDAGAAQVTVDLAEVPYIDSTGIGVLVGASHHAAETGSALKVVNPQRNVRRVLDMLGVTAELGIDA